MRDLERINPGDNIVRLRELFEPRIDALYGSGVVSGTLRARWRREVLRADSKRLPDSVRVLCLALHDEMHENGHVQVSRSALAAKLGRAERRISERIEQAMHHGWLDRIQRGAPGQYAIYTALVPPPNAEPAPRRATRPWSSLRETDGGPAIDGTDGGPANRGRAPAGVGGGTGVPLSSRLGGGRPPGDGGPA